MCDACGAFTPAEEEVTQAVGMLLSQEEAAAEVESYKAQVEHLEGLVTRNALQACRYEAFLRRIAYNPYSEVDSVALVRGIAKHAIEHTEDAEADYPTWCSTCRANKPAVHEHFANDFTPAQGTRH